MKIYNSISEFSTTLPIVGTTGTFDGVHLGHRQILKRMSESAREMEGETLLLTFYPHPRMVLFPENNDLRLLCSQEEKIELLRETGLDHLVIHPFTREFSRHTSIEFVRDILIHQLHVKKLVIGYDHQFGRNREGSFEELVELSDLYGFEVEEVQAQNFGEIDVSSTKIRKALNAGDAAKANAYLSSNYLLSGTVVEGEKLGRKIGFPTANIALDFAHKLIPAPGAYAVRVRCLGNFFKGMLNIGIRPTVNTGNQLTLEVHIFDFDQSIYGESIQVELVDRIRNEVKFEGIEALQKQLHADREKSLSILG
ncbi:bifunctional riboflavin kinase/FAD synthetase [bacterium SCSIO 12741]|nr:bifunctional riboflavin kinase/FAD synthetase [bacterium SCSIO 12741]